jgi:hypothetical protein
MRRPSACTLLSWRRERPRCRSLRGLHDELVRRTRTCPPRPGKCLRRHVSSAGTGVALCLRMRSEATSPSEASRDGTPCAACRRGSNGRSPTGERRHAPATPSVRPGRSRRCRLPSLRHKIPTPSTAGGSRAGQWDSRNGSSPQPSSRLRMRAEAVDQLSS